MPSSTPTRSIPARWRSLVNPSRRLFDEQVRFLGRSVEIIPYAPSGTGMLMKTVAKHVGNHNNAYMMANHGALLLGGRYGTRRA